MGQRSRPFTSMTLALAAFGLLACQGGARNASTPVQPIVSPVSTDLTLVHQVGQLTVNQGLLLSTVADQASPLPLNQQLVNAVKNDDWQAAEAVLTDGAVPDAGDYVTGYVLPMAAENNNLRLVKLLVERGADVNIAGQDGETALAKAIHQGNLEIVDFLLQQGAHPNNGVGDQPPLVLAIQTGRPDMVELLLNHGANPKPAAISLIETTSKAKQQAQAQYTTINQMLTEAGAR